MTPGREADDTPAGAAGPGWWEIEAARQRVLSMLPPVATERVPLAAAPGRVLAEDLWAHLPLPGFDNSAMDGYALGAGELKAGTQWLVTGEQPAGRALSPPATGPGAGEAWRIFTGAPIPSGTVAVVMQEDTEPLEPGRIRLTDAAEPGQFIRRAGSDLCAGQSLLRAGRRLTARDLGLLATQGLANITVARPPRLAVVTTGDECRPPGVGLAPGELYESNGIMLSAMATANGANVTAVASEPDAGDPAGPATTADAAWQHVGDDRARLRQVLGALLERVDMVVVSGGVSVGRHDHVRPVLADLGCETHVWRLRMKPGKPFVFATHHNGARVFGLPGNPVSSAVTFQLLVAPAVRAAQGAPAAPAEGAAVLAEAIDNRGDRPHYLRVRQTATPAADGRPQLRLVGRQGSDALSGLARSDGLLRVEPGQSLAAGTDVRWLPWPEGI